jgi:hypothetical protein
MIATTRGAMIAFFILHDWRPVPYFKPDGWRAYAQTVLMDSEGRRLRIPPGLTSARFEAGNLGMERRRKKVAKFEAEGGMREWKQITTPRLRLMYEALCRHMEAEHPHPGPLPVPVSVASWP